MSHDNYQKQEQTCAVCGVAIWGECKCIGSFTTTCPTHGAQAQRSIVCRHCYELAHVRREAMEECIGIVEKHGAPEEQPVDDSLTIAWLDGYGDACANIGDDIRALIDKPGEW